MFTSFHSIIGYGAFADCTFLDSIDIKATADNIISEDLKHRESLSKGIASNSASSIQGSAFYRCSSLRSVCIPSSIQSIGDAAFAHCISLKRIHIPSSVRTMGCQVFSHCNSLISIDIPPQVRTIKMLAFAYCSSLTSVNVPPSTHNIEKWAFDGCTSLGKIKIPPSVRVIEDKAFAYCTSLLTVGIRKGCLIEKTSFPETTNLSYGWYEVGPFVLLRELFMNKRATTQTLDEGNCNSELEIIQAFIINTNDDIFRYVLTMLV